MKSNKKSVEHFHAIIESYFPPTNGSSTSLPISPFIIMTPHDDEAKK